MAANTTLIIQTGLKELASVLLNPAQANRVRMYEPVGRGPIMVHPTAEEANWFGAVVEKNGNMPATRTVGNWRSSFEGAQILGKKDTIAASEIVIARRGRFGSIHMDDRTHEITIVYYGADVRLASGRFMVKPIVPRRLFY
jgi:hypothetical protein